MALPQDKLYNQPVANLMLQVQACPWNPFKMNEIVTLERCLLEEATLSVSMRSFLRKLANECVFVEPIRKQHHLSRNDTEKRRDRELKQKAQFLRETINNLNDEIELIRAKLNYLLKRQNEYLQTIDQMRRSIMLLETSYDKSYRHFELVFEKAHFSFNRSFATIRTKIPRFINALKGSDLVRQVELPPIKCRKLKKKLVKEGKHYHQDQQMATQLSYHLKRALITNLQTYHTAITKLHRDLNTINDAFITDIPDETRSLRSWKNHIEHLKQPLVESVKRVTVVFQDKFTCTQPELVSGPPKDTEDPKFCELFKTLSVELRSHSFDAPQKSHVRISSSQK